MITEEQVMPVVLSKLSKLLEREATEADLDKGYDSLGADSMDMVVLAFEVEEETGLEILPEIFLRYDSLREAMKALLEESQGRG